MNVYLKILASLILGIVCWYLYGAWIYPFHDSLCSLNATETREHIVRYCWSNSPFGLLLITGVTIAVIILWVVYLVQDRKDK
jgi:hypothetical protein